MNSESCIPAPPTMVHRHRLESAGGHLIVVDPPRRYLIDTGSPLSLGDREIQFVGQRHEAADSLAGVTIADVREQLDTEVDALIGMDILSRWRLLFDLPGGQLLCSAADFTVPAAATRHAVRDVGGVPFVQGRLDDDEPARFAFDTGAQLGYLGTAPATGPGPIRTVEDFFPRLGRFETPVYRRRFCLLNDDGGDGTAVELEFGVLPGMLGLALGLAGASGIVGVELLRDRPVWFSPGEWLAVGPPGPSGLTP